MRPREILAYPAHARCSAKEHASGIAVGKSRGILMRLLVVTVSLILTLVSPAYARECTLTDEEWIGREYPSLKSWSSVYESYRAYTPECDDPVVRIR